MTTVRTTPLPHGLDEPHHLDPGPAPTGPPRALRRRRRTAAGVAGAAVMVAVAGLALGGGSTQALGLAPAAEVPGTEVPARPATSGVAPPAPVAEPAPAAPAADGVPPVADLVVDGPDTATVTGFADRDGQVVVTTNRIQLLTGDEADAYAAARGWEVPVPNDQLLVDDSPRLRDYPVRPDAAVTLTIPLTQDPDGEPTATALPALRRLLAARADGDVHPFELAVEDGVVVAFRMLYQP